MIIVCFPFRHSTTRNITDGFETTVSSHFQEPIVEERNSLAALKIFITHACEVLELWKILCENHVNNIVNCLSKVDALFNTHILFCLIR